MLETVPSWPVAEAGQFKGDRLRYWRLSRGLTQRELAELVKTDTPAISRLEGDKSGEPKARTVRKLAEALGIQPDQLTDQPASKDRDVEEMLSRMLPAADVRQIMRQIRLYQQEHKRRRK